MASAPVVQTSGLSRDFKRSRAVDGLDLSVARGELFGLVGPDGAGKTTTLRLLAGLLDISAGDAHVAGFSLRDDAEAVKSHIGYMAQEFSLYGELTVLENLHFFAEVYEVPKEQLGARTERLLDFAGLIEFKSRRAAKLSGGMKKKLALASTLIHEPEILLLDEPTTGVDPISRRDFWEILIQLHLEGTTIVVSTPYMDEADRCTRVGLMYQGEMVICDTPQNIRARLEGEILELRPKDWANARGKIEALPGVSQVQTYGEAYHLVVDSAERRREEIEMALRARGVQVKALRKMEARMEEAFISLIREMRSRGVARS
jgi:ABC-2 type transport system ATP-binding protein